jgi:RimJ/RimL family protein N-acetyltransferase
LPGEPFPEQGITTKTIKEMADFALKAYNIDRIFAKPHGTNIACQRVPEKAGFKPGSRFEKTIIKIGEYPDEPVYAFRR